MVKWHNRRADIAKFSTQGSDIVAIIKACSQAGVISLEAELGDGPVKLTFASPAPHTDESLELVSEPTNQATPLTNTQPFTPSISETREQQNAEQELSLDQLILTDPERYEEYSLGASVGKPQSRRA